MPGEPGVYEITTPCTWAEVGHRLGGSPYARLERLLDSAAERERERRFVDFQARLVLSRQPVAVNAPRVTVPDLDAEIRRMVELGLIHESLVAEPNGTCPERPLVDRAAAA